MSGHGTTLARPRRCAYCGRRIHGERTCYRHFGLVWLDPHFVAERLPTIAAELRREVKRR